MKYNQSYTGGTFDSYPEYLDSVKGKIPAGIIEFVSNPRRHDFSEESLHDSQLKSFECISDFDAETTRIKICLSGAYRDREFYLHFENVSQYRVSHQMSDRHRDLITYEIGVEEDCYEEERMVFRAEFSGDDTLIEVYAEHIEIEERITAE